MRAISRRKTDVYTVTDAPRPMSEDIDHRQRRYLISMGIRTACFLGAIAAAGRTPLWVVGILVVGSLVLPYVSVIFANGGREPQPTATFGNQEGTTRKEISGPGHENG